MWAIVLVIVAVLVAVLLILAVVLLTMVGGLVTDGPTRPVVSLTAEVVGATDVRIDIAGATPAEPLARFRATLFVNDSAAETIAPLGDDNTGVLRFSDRDGGGRLTGGDRFIITWVTPGRYELVLLWTDGSRIVGRVWTI